MHFLYLFVGIVLGGLLVFFAYKAFWLNRKRELVEKQSVILLEKVRNVCKLVMVEGEFAEIYNHENNKDYLFGLLQSKKKALLQVNAKVHIGYDLKKLEIITDNYNKTLILNKFPEPEVLSFENNFKIYDLENGVFNKFSPEEISNLQVDAKQFILDKIPESSLMESAKKEAVIAISIMQNIVETIGWQLDTQGLKLESKETKFFN
ncbi:MAG: DUF4230 domain-containing protein [Flavobacterium sp.]|nr:DUF4230 domain-containing protein [Flavobacterium sp.]